MNKEDIYRLIGYQGEYNTKVKKAIRKLLKENHPDNKGNRDKFELINEVKKELELGKVSYHPEKQDTVLNNNTDIDYDYCYEVIDSIKSKKNTLNSILNEKKEKLHFYELEYKNLYDESLNIENNLLTNSPNLKKLRKIKIFSIILVVLMIILFVISIIKNNNTIFILFVILSMVCILTIQDYLYLMHHITVNNKNKLTTYVKMNNRIRRNISKQNEIKKDIRDIKRKITNMENDLRFYKNLLK